MTALKKQIAGQRVPKIVRKTSLVIDENTEVCTYLNFGGLENVQS